MSSHYFDADPHTTSRPTEVRLLLADRMLLLATDRGMFSPDRVDPGTRVLLDSVPPPPQEGTLLDLGCGYGPIALTMAARAPRAQVLGVDVNGRAVDRAWENAEQNHLDNVDFVQVDEGAAQVEPETAPAIDGPFAALWSNPPIRIGKEALRALLALWLDRLAPGASAHLVAHKHLGGGLPATLAGRTRQRLRTRHLPQRVPRSVCRISVAPASVNAPPVPTPA